LTNGAMSDGDDAAPNFGLKASPNRSLDYSRHQQQCQHE
jgi:hypothetical protein